MILLPPECLLNTIFHEKVKKLIDFARQSRNVSFLYCLNAGVIPACIVCHSDLFGIILKKDAGQASMTDRGRIADKPQ